MRLLSRLLVGLGICCLVAALALIWSSTWNQFQHAQQAPLGPRELLPVRAAAVPTEAPIAVPVPTTAPQPTATLAPAPSPTPVPDYGKPTWITIPSIGLDNQIVEVGIKNGAYDASWWDVGHQKDSPDPGEPGNSVFNGHVSTINAGHVFRNLKDVKAGDAVFVYSDVFRTEWSVTDVLSVPSDESDFMDQTPDARVTLYTCDGVWNPVDRQFSNRLVVVGQFVGVEQR